jgi:multiple sugar transport system ATP-binding protein
VAEIVLNEVTKRYPDGTEAVKNMSLEVADGEFVIFVGPSGCGKTTALRMIAGLEDITEGELRIGDRVVNDLPPRDRDIAMVFQNYALYPHMTVRENMGFALKLHKVEQSEIDQRVEEAAETLDLSEHLDRKPANLSGGQRQRVAMGRAIVRKPSAFLMDEPLSNLDAKLRVQMRAAVSRLQQRLGTTTIYVTHDQTEAMTLGDRVAVMRAGVVQQVGSPRQLYNEPTNLFVAGFIGSPAMNFFAASVEGDTVKLPVVDLQVHPDVMNVCRGTQGLIAGVRPEHFEDAALIDAERRRSGVTFRTQVELVESMGAELYVYFPIAGGIESQELAELAADAGTAEVPGAGEEGLGVARLPPESEARTGQEIELWLDPQHVHFFDSDGGRCLTSRPTEPAPAATA